MCLWRVGPVRHKRSFLRACLTRHLPRDVLLFLGCSMRLLLLRHGVYAGIETPSFAMRDLSCSLTGPNRKDPSVQRASWLQSSLGLLRRIWLQLRLLYHGR